MQNVYDLERRTYKPVPVVLLDYSGSVMSPFCGTKTVLAHLIDLLKELSVRDNFTEVELVYWSDVASVKKLVKVEALSHEYVVKHSTVPSAGTNIVPALKRINIYGDGFIADDNEVVADSDDDIDIDDEAPVKKHKKKKDSKKVQNKNTFDRVYILTDGEIADDDTELYQALSLIKKNNKSIEVRMIVLEANDKNYLVEDCAVGNKLLRAVRSNSMNNFFKYIFFFNRRYRTLRDRFVNLYNADLSDEYVQYDDKCFHIKNYPVFLANITKEIIDLRTKLTIDGFDMEAINIPKEDMLDDVMDDIVDDLIDEREKVRHVDKNDITMGKLEKIGYNLIKTIKDLEVASANNKNFNKRQVIDFFCNLIGIGEITDFLKRELIYGVDNKTFQEYKERRAKLFNGTQLNMYQNLQSALCNGSLPLHYTSFISDDGVVYDIEAIDIEHSINIGVREYKNAAIYDSTRRRLVPVIPIQARMSAQMKQALRQWIRAIYARRYGIPASSDLIHYTFLIDNMYIQCSDLPNHIKDAYIRFSDVMLDRVRYGESIKERDYLSKGERPKPIGSKESFEKFLASCPNYPTKQHSEEKTDEDNNELDPMTVWFIILASLGQDNSHILSAQAKYCTKAEHDKIIDDSFDEYVSSYYSNKKSKKYYKSSKNNINRDHYTSDILENAKPYFSNNTEFEICKIKIDEKLVTPNYYCFITLNDTSDTGGYMFYTHKNHEANDKVCRPNYVISEEAYDAYKSGTAELKCPYCGTAIELSRMTKLEPKDEYEQRADVVKREREIKRIYKRVEVYDNFSKELINLNELDFRNDYSHRVFFKEHLVLGSTMDSYSVMRFNTADKQSEFNAKVPKFLFQINWDNIVVAGGMCRSILLGQKIQDIDIFFIGLDEEGVRERILSLINDVVVALQSESPDYRFILMYKPLNSVVELLCTKSTFDESTVNEDDDDLNIDEKFLFINNEIVHKVQIILRVHKDIEEIFHNFDMYPSCVAFDGDTTYFSEASYVAYKFMINMVDREKASHSAYDHRSLKYYKYGFSYALDKKQINAKLLNMIESSPKMIKIGGCVFEPVAVDSNIVINDGDTPEKVEASRFRYVPLNNLQLVKKTQDKTTDDSCDVKSTEHGGAQKSAPMYESYDELDTNMIGLYNYMTGNGIRYCYVMGEIEKNEVDDVLDVDEIDFLQNKRDETTFNWYDNNEIIVAQ
ncbi:hypothetical protein YASMINEVIRUS_899 [Yasminevirus sp. GU-2018]|uniref:VWFA domain-containing protein n=1 Tax=Yasminevirus sp. GU-2018 TaxID=2420051 RepID=A0A5K0UBH1_9VIRU|nr:hypothetical protein YASMINEVIRUS_899 [Yasminevirus sp. GU-2018]